MTKFQFSRILAICSLCLAAMGLSSCTTAIDTGGYLDAVGKEAPSHQLVEKKVTWGTTQEKAPSSVYKRDSTYYVELPVAYIPAVIRDANFLLINMGIFVGRGEEFIVPDVKADMSEVRKHQLCRETYYAILTEEQFQTACTGWGKFEAPPINNETFPILPAAEVDLQGARLVNMENRYIDVEHIIKSKMPCRRTTGNQLRRPLAFVLDVADIPLMFAAAPVGWVSRLIYYSFD